MEERGASWRAATVVAGRRLAAITAAGALAGLLVGGVGGRLAMLLLAVLNDRATGLVSDDGFEIGRFTLAGTLNLLAVGAGLGVLGAGIYALLRGLRLGPRWFQVVSLSVGPGVVVGAMLVHVEGVDFTFLRPLWLAVSLFVLIPGLYGAALTLLAERWVRDDGWFARGHAAAVAPVLLLWAPLFPFLAGLVAGWAVLEAARRRGWLPTRVRTVAPWALRAALTVLFALSLVDLWSDVGRLA